MFLSFFLAAMQILFPRDLSDRELTNRLLATTLLVD
jgi:hypothetical protein